VKVSGKAVKSITKLAELEDVMMNIDSKPAAVSGLYMFYREAGKKICTGRSAVEIHSSS
jgi:hypothetical protein